MNTKGFSLIELLIVTTIAGLLIALISTTYVNLLFVSNRTRSTAQIQQLTDQILIQLTQQIQFGSGLQIHDPTSLSFINDQNQTVTYSWDGSNLLFLTITDADGTTLSNHSLTDTSYKVTNFNITTQTLPTDLAAGYKITLEITSSKNIPGQPPTVYNNTTSISQRNQFSI